MNRNNARPSNTEPTPTRAPIPEQLPIVARYLLSSRRRRDLALTALEFGEPAWDILLELYLQHAEGRRISVSNLCDASVVSESTALRWIRTMVDVELLLREPDTVDRRRVFVSLAPNLLQALESYLSEELQRLAPVMRRLWPSG